MSVVFVLDSEAPGNLTSKPHMQTKQGKKESQKLKWPQWHIHVTLESRLKHKGLEFEDSLGYVAQQGVVCLQSPKALITYSQTQFQHLRA